MLAQHCWHWGGGGGPADSHMQQCSLVAPRLKCNFPLVCLPLHPAIWPHACVMDGVNPTDTYIQQLTAGGSAPMKGGSARKVAPKDARGRDLRPVLYHQKSVKVGVDGP